MSLNQFLKEILMDVKQNSVLLDKILIAKFNHMILVWIGKFRYAA
jgi:hypothetical protein